VIDFEKPEPKAIGVLLSETMGESRGSRHFQIVQHNDGANRRLVHREKKCVLAFRRIRRAIDEDQSRLLQTEKGFALRGDVEGLNRTEPIPTAGERHNFGKIRRAPGDAAFELLGAAQVIGGIFDARRAGRSAAERMSGTAGAKFKRGASGGKQRENFFQETATARRKDPGGNLVRRSGVTIVFLDETVELIFERRI